MKVISDLSVSGRRHRAVSAALADYATADGRVPVAVYDSVRHMSGSAGGGGAAGLRSGLRPPLALQRDSAVLAQAASGQAYVVPPDQPALDWSSGARRLQMRAVRRNHFTYARLDHAALASLSQSLGTVHIDGSSGGITAEVVATGVDAAGAGFLDWRLSGTNGGSTGYFNIADGQVITGVAAGTSTVMSAQLSLAQGVLPDGVSVRLYRHCRNTAGAVYGGGAGDAAVTAVPQRFAHVFEQPAGYDQITAAGLFIRVAAGAGPMDFVLRVSEPQFELDRLGMGDPVATAGAVAARAGDQLLCDLAGLDQTAGVSARVVLSDYHPARAAEVLLRFEQDVGAGVDLLWDSGAGTFALRDPAGAVTGLAATAFSSDLTVELQLAGSTATVLLNDALLGTAPLPAPFVADRAVVMDVDALLHEAAVFLTV